jgi:hypothetical protein
MNTFIADPSLTICVMFPQARRLGKSDVALARLCIRRGTMR